MNDRFAAGRSVVVSRSDVAFYPSVPPYCPSTAYPEYSFGAVSAQCNPVYDLVRESFLLAGLDKERAGSPEWNPLADLIAPGEHVLLKPNLIKESHPRFEEGWAWVLTHGSVIRAVADYTWLAVGESGHVSVADAPQTDSSFTKIAQVLGLDRLQDFYAKQGRDLPLIDLRREEWVNEDGVIIDRLLLPGDPAGNVAFDLAERSEFAAEGGPPTRFYGADYDERVVNFHHSDGRHEYLIAKSAIDADVIFSLPKLKTHKKAGVTASLKNLVGVNGDKNWLPHHTEGSPADGGDEHPSRSASHRLERSVAKRLRWLAVHVPTIGTRTLKYGRAVGSNVFGDTETTVRSGNWWGNDTIWRTCLDLNKIIFYGNPDGTLRAPVAGNRKRHLVLVDAVIAGEGSGPQNPDPVHCGMVIFGAHPASVDATAAVVAGLDPDRIPIIREAFRCATMPIAEGEWPEVVMRSNRPDWNELRLGDVGPRDRFAFKPHFGWVGHIELNGRGDEHLMTSRRRPAAPK